MAIVAGEGNESAYPRSAGASRIVAGGQSMNPSAGEIAQAIAAADAEGVVVLPNNGNVILAAEHAAALADRPVRVVPTRSVATGLALMEGYSPSAPLGQTADAMARRNAALRYGELTTAVRDARVDGVAVHDGEHLALVDGRVVASTGDPSAAADAMLGRLAEDGAERIVLLRGDADAFDPGPWLARARLAHPQVQLELRDGGQPLYPLLAWAEGRVLLTAENTALVLDSTSDAGSPQGLPANWRVVPLSVRLGDRSYLDYVEMPPEEFYRRLPLEADLPQTAAPAPGAFQAAFEELAGYSRIFVLPISSEVSATSRSAELAARELDPGGERIAVLETQAVSAATLLLADGLQRLLVRGVPENTLVTWFERGEGAAVAAVQRGDAGVPAQGRPHRPCPGGGRRAAARSPAADAAGRRGRLVRPGARRVARPARVRALPLRAPGRGAARADRAVPRPQPGGSGVAPGDDRPRAPRRVRRPRARAGGGGGHARRSRHRGHGGADRRMTLRGFAGAALDGPPPEPATAPRPSHLEEPPTARQAAALGPRGDAAAPAAHGGRRARARPFRYEDYRDAMRIADLRPGEQATIVCTVDSIRMRPTRRRNLAIVEARVHDDSGPGLVVWFNQRYLVKQLTPGTVISVRGERRGSIGAEISAKSHEVLGEGTEALHTHGMVPVYHGSEAVTSRRLRTLVDGLLGPRRDAPDALPADLRQRRRLPLRRDATLAAHRPEEPGDVRTAKGRLAFDELFLLQVGLVRHRRLLEGMAAARSLGKPGELVGRYLEQLPFDPTKAQARAMREIDRDLAKDVPMQRLLQGDVGSGKTAVACTPCCGRSSATARGR